MPEPLHHLLRSTAFWIIAPNFVMPAIVFIVSVLRRHPMEMVATNRAALPEYVRAMNESALSAGFQFDQLAIDRSNRSLASLWFSPDRRILVMIRVRRTFGVPHRQTWLFSHSPEGRILATSDAFGEVDLSGYLRAKRAIRGGFTELLALHHERLSRYGAKSAPFAGATAKESYNTLEATRVNRMIARRLAQYVNGNQNCWRYTLKGAMRNCLAVSIAVLESLGHILGIYQRPTRSEVD